MVDWKLLALMAKRDCVTLEGRCVRRSEEPVISAASPAHHRRCSDRSGSIKEILYYYPFETSKMTRPMSFKSTPQTKRETWKLTVNCLVCRLPHPAMLFIDPRCDHRNGKDQRNRYFRSRRWWSFGRFLRRRRKWWRRDWCGWHLIFGFASSSLLFSLFLFYRIRRVVLLSCILDKSM